MTVFRPTSNYYHFTSYLRASTTAPHCRREYGALVY